MNVSEMNGLSEEQRELLRLLMEREGVSTRELPIPRRERAHLTPLSSAQHRVWYLDQFNQQRAAYNVTKAVHLSGPLNRPALQKAFDALVVRHEILRTVYVHENDSPMQQVSNPRPVDLLYFDLEEMEFAAGDQHVRRLIEEEARRPFDLTADLMIRAACVRLAADEHVLLVALHHIAADAWSLGILFSELEHLYKAYSVEAEPSLPALPIQYADYAAWDRERFASGASSSDLDYWRKKLADAPAVLDLPTDRPLRAERTMRGALTGRVIPETLCVRLKELARREGATFFVALLAAFESLVQRYSGQLDFCVGSPITGRTKAETEPLIGFFLNTLVFRADFSTDPSFREILRRTQQTTLEAFEHQDVPFDQLVEALRPQRSASQTPFFQVMFVLQDARGHKLDLTGSEARAYEVDLGAARFDLHLTAQDTGNGLGCILEYDTDLFDAATAERMLGHFEILLRGMIESPDRPVAAIPILTDAEQQQLLVEWNRTDRAVPPQCIHELVTRAAVRNPQATAVICDGQSLTYGELIRRSHLLALDLRRRGVTNGSLVGLFVDRSVDMVVALLGVLAAGGAYVPLDPAFPRERLAFMVQDSGTMTLLTQSSLISELPARVGNVIVLDEFDWSAAPDPARLPQVRHADLCYVLYTSGSTGKPKGVAIEHGALVNAIESFRRVTDFRIEDRTLCVTTLSFDIAGLDLFLPLTVGASLVVAARETASDANRIIALLESADIRVMQATPATWRMLIESGWQGKPDLKILSGGEKLPRALADQLLERGSGVWNFYGPTETTIYSTVARVQSGEERLSIGRAIDNTTLYVLNAHLQPSPAGVYGELYIGGAGVAREYLFRPDLTAEKFIRNPFGEGRIYKTGDVVRWREDGTLDFLRRADDQVKLRGFRIELGEIESILVRHAAIHASCAIIREDTPGDPFIAAYYIVEPGRSVTVQELRDFLRQLLPEYMVPARFVALEKFPLTPNGKIDRRALPAPPVDRLANAAESEPRTPMQQVVAEVWEAALGIEGIGVNDNFFDLGGHSLLSVQVLRELRQRTGVLLTPRDMVFQSLGQLASQYEQQPPSEKKTGFINRLSGVVQKAISKGV